ncbi:hypothetical protein R3P38DRAFT_2761195 [Favolaschia claudopus]|uniref:Uncharacterized protein n=1 Tax=Favolaschia claudopus TaxID=2862362 RepID=A0AAW0DY83_9AGAR
MADCDPLAVGSGPRATVAETPKRQENKLENSGFPAHLLSELQDGRAYEKGWPRPIQGRGRIRESSGSVKYTATSQLSVNSQSPAPKSECSESANGHDCRDGLIPTGFDSSLLMSKCIVCVPTAKCNNEEIFAMCRGGVNRDSGRDGEGGQAMHPNGRKKNDRTQWRIWKWKRESRRRPIPGQRSFGDGGGVDHRLPKVTGLNSGPTSTLTVYVRRNVCSYSTDLVCNGFTWT